MKSRLFSPLLLGALSTLPFTALQAGEPDFATPLTTAPAAGDPWELIVSPYGWLAGLDGSVGIGGVVTDVDMSFGDIFENLEIGAMLAVEARKGRWGIQVDGLWLRLTADASTPGPGFGRVGVEVEELRLAPMLSYRVLEGSTNVDVLAGFQYFKLDTDIKFNAGLLPSVTASSSEEWIDPMVGVRINHQLNEKWSLLLRGDIGGFGAASDFVWQALGAVGYQVSANTTLLAGYRHLDVDYSDGGFVYDTSTSGFILGANMTF